MSEPVTIDQVETIERDRLIVELSDGRSLRITLDQVFSLNPEVLSQDEAQDDHSRPR